MNVTFPRESNNRKENIQSFLVSISLSLCLESYIFFFIFRWDGLYSFIPLESLFISSSGTAPSSMHQTCAGIIQYILRVHASLCWCSIRYSRLHHRYVLNGHKAQTILILDLCLLTAQSHQCSVFGMSKLTSCCRQAAESRMVLRSDSDSWSCPPCRLTRILRRLAINGVHRCTWFDGHPSYKHRGWTMWLCFTSKWEQILNSCHFEVKGIQRAFKAILFGIKDVTDLGQR
jgi:hypothetical protein